jgi:uncharacterized protein YigE (DUF2233 family)
MGKNSIFKTIFVASVIMLMAASLFAEPYNEETYFKDYVTNKGESLVVAVNRDTEQVELYWSDANKSWLKPDKQEQLGLQRLYAKSVQLHEMEAGLNKMRNDTWYTTNQNIGSQQGRR